MEQCKICAGKVRCCLPAGHEGDHGYDRNHRYWAAVDPLAGAATTPEGSRGRCLAMHDATRCCRGTRHEGLHKSFVGPWSKLWTGTDAEADLVGYVRTASDDEDLVAAEPTVDIKEE